VRTLRSADGAVIDEGVVLWFPAPASYTGEDCAELSVHGGPAVVETLIETLAGLGLRLADLVRKETCAEVARAMDVGPALKLGNSESHAGGRLRVTILGDACEALIGAVFLDGGYGAAEELVARFWKERMLKPLRPLRDPKTMLQEWAQARGLPTPAYRELARTGPHHDPEFRVAVALPDRPPAEGLGSSKRAAEQNAAAAMLERVGVAVDKLDG
jgi:ribonuclease-3